MSERLRVTLYETFDTAQLLQAINTLDSLRALLAERESASDIRTALLELHRLAHRFIHEGGAYDEALWDAAFALEDQLDIVMVFTQRIRAAVEALTALAPDPESEDEEALEDWTG
jgi:hypothetical protein